MIQTVDVILQISEVDYHEYLKCNEVIALTSNIFPIIYITISTSRSVKKFSAKVKTNKINTWLSLINVQNKIHFVNMCYWSNKL